MTKTLYAFDWDHTIAVNSWNKSMLGCDVMDSTARENKGIASPVAKLWGNKPRAVYQNKMQALLNNIIDNPNACLSIITAGPKSKSQVTGFLAQQLNKDEAGISKKIIVASLIPVRSKATMAQAQADFLGCDKVYLIDDHAWIKQQAAQQADNAELEYIHATTRGANPASSYIENLRGTLPTTLNTSETKDEINEAQISYLLKQMQLASPSQASQVTEKHNILTKVTTLTPNDIKTLKKHRHTGHIALAVIASVLLPPLLLVGLIQLLITGAISLTNKGNTGVRWLWHNTHTRSYQQYLKNLQAEEPMRTKQPNDRVEQGSAVKAQAPTQMPTAPIQLAAAVASAQPGEMTTHTNSASPRPSIATPPTPKTTTDGTATHSQQNVETNIALMQKNLGANAGKMQAQTAATIASNQPAAAITPNQHEKLSATTPSPRTPITANVARRLFRTSTNRSPWKGMRKEYRKHNPNATPKQEEVAKAIAQFFKDHSNDRRMWHKFHENKVRLFELRDQAEDCGLICGNKAYTSRLLPTAESHLKKLLNRTRGKRPEVNNTRRQLFDSINI